MDENFIKRLERILKKCIDNPNYIDKYLFCRVSDFSQREYEYYHFEDKLWKRFTFVSYRQCERNFEKYNKTITDKRDNYLLLSKYYSRDCCLLEPNCPNGENEKLLRSFTENHKQFIAKTFDGSSGLGVRKYEAEQSNSWVEKFLEIYSGGCLLEELINQTQDLALIHPWSVNTLRITSVNYGDHIETIYPVMRFGIGKELTDNGKSGLLCAVDQKTGEIISAMNGKGEKFYIHPDTGQTIVGFYVPEMQSAVDLAKRLAVNFPDNIFTGFDFAHTKSGWILVEVNTETRFTIWQLPYQKGFKKDLKQIERYIARM